MKFTDYIITFFFIFCCFALVTFYFINRESAVAIDNAEYTNALTIACHDAAKTIKTEKLPVGVWADNNDRTYTLETFYDTLRFCFNTELTARKDEIYQFIPIICLIDNTGYYISYNSAFDPYGNYPTTTVTDDAKTMTVSTLNTWTKAYNNGCIVRFYLNDMLEVTIPKAYMDYHANANDRITIQGTRADLIDRLKDADDPFDIPDNAVNEELLYLFTKSHNVPSVGSYTADEWYETVKYETIVDSINREVTYYINHQNIWDKDNNINYEFTMPKIAEEEWHRLLTNPTVISFLQGRQTQSKNTFLNTYSLGGGELIFEQKYFITEDTDAYGNKTLVYHILAEGVCPDHTVQKHVDNVNQYYRQRGIQNSKQTKSEYYTCDGEIIIDTYNNMAVCARLGAVPCECVRNHNH